MRNLAQKNLADEVRSWIEETGMTKRICHMQTSLAKSSIHIDLKHTICRAYRKRNLVTQLGGHYILLSEWAPQKIPHLPPENLDTSFSLFHASREKLTYSPAKARAQENKTPRDRQKKRQKLGERFCFCFWDLRRPSAAARRNSSTGAGLRGSTSKSTRHCTPLSFQFLLLLWLIPWVVFDSSGILAELHWGKLQSVNMLPSLDCWDSLFCEEYRLRHPPPVLRKCLYQQQSRAQVSSNVNAINPLPPTNLQGTRISIQKVSNPKERDWKIFQWNFFFISFIFFQREREREREREFSVEHSQASRENEREREAII
jgi:hypothetical protein